MICYETKGQQKGNWQLPGFNKGLGYDLEYPSILERRKESTIMFSEGKERREPSDILLLHHDVVVVALISMPPTN
jgi:hypothetical protein